MALVPPEWRSRRIKAGDEEEAGGKKQSSYANVNKWWNNCDHSEMSIVFVPKKLRGKAKINQETIQRVRQTDR